MSECPCDRDKTVDPHCCAAGMCVREDDPCEHCGGDESKCDFDYKSSVCSEMERMFADDGRPVEMTSGEQSRKAKKRKPKRRPKWRRSWQSPISR